MSRKFLLGLLFAFQLVGVRSLLTQQPAGNTTASTVPRLVSLSGKVLDAQGKPLPGVASVTFSIYRDEQGGEPLWSESQNVQADAEGSYTVQLGAMEPAGIPLALFSSGESRWLGISINGANERPRALLLSVPYALKAADAETLGGLPPSAYQRVGSSSTVGASTVPKPQATTPTPITGTGVVNYLPMWTQADVLGDSAVYQKNSAIGIGLTNPAATLDVNGKADVRDTLQIIPKGTDPALSVYATNFKVDQTGKVTFVTGQTYPGAGTLTGITTSATSGLQGGATTGSPNLSVKSAGITNTMLQHPSLTIPVTAPLVGGGSVALGASAAALSLKPCPAGEVYISNGTTWSCTAAAGTGKVTNVALKAPASDFTVTGSPITGAGTLGLNWTIPPTSADTASSIVKRDSSGSFSAGAIYANLGMEGITATDSGNGVAGLNTGGGTAIYGAASNGVGVWGQSSGSGGVSDGVHGVTASAGGSGVAGVNNNGGVGVYGVGGTGVFGTGTVGFATDSNVQQATNANGWIKAMFFVNGYVAPYNIIRCFNSTLTGAAATTPPCGVNFTEYSFGIFNLQFNFPISNRFWTAQLTNGEANCISVFEDDAYTLGTFTFDCGDSPKGGEYMLIVY